MTSPPTPAERFAAVDALIAQGDVQLAIAKNALDRLEGILRQLRGNPVTVTDDEEPVYCGTRYWNGSEWDWCDEPYGHDGPHGDPALRAACGAVAPPELAGYRCDLERGHDGEHSHAGSTWRDATAADADLYRESVAAEQAEREQAAAILAASVASGTPLIVVDDEADGQARTLVGTPVNPASVTQ